MAETHIDKIMKLLVLSGKKNPNRHERENALEMATRLMERHRLTIDDMRSRYRDWRHSTFLDLMCSRCSSIPLMSRCQRAVRMSPTPSLLTSPLVGCELTSSTADPTCRTR